MAIPRFLKRKSTYILLGVLLIGAFLYQQNRIKRSQPVFETARVTAQNLLQTVEVTGEIKPSERIDLSFERSGTIESIHAKVGQTVAKGSVLMQLKNEDLLFAQRNAEASLARARATLNQKTAGFAEQEIRISETNVSKAKAAYEKSVSDLASARLTVQDNLKSARIALSSAESKLANQTLTLDQNLRNTLDTSRIVLLTALGPLQTGLTDGDAVVGVDDTTANDDYESVLGITDSSLVPKAKVSYTLAKTAKLEAEVAVGVLSATSTREDIFKASDRVLNATLQVQNFLGDVQKVLAGTIPSASFTASELTTLKSKIDADRTSISAQNTAVLNAMQAVKNVELANADTKQQLTDAYQTALVNYDIAKTKSTTDVTAAESNVLINRAALDSAQAELALKRAAARETDLAPLRAAVLEAAIAVEKAASDLRDLQLIAPVDGIVSEVAPSPGELVAVNVVAVKMLSMQTYDIETLVPESDIAKVRAGQAVTSTLDAYGDNVAFRGVVLSIEPDQTKVQDAVYYKTRISIDAQDRNIRPGMTANVTILTQQATGILVIPLRAVRTKEETKETVVRVLEQNVPREVVVELGLRGDEGRVEVTKGLKEGQEVILSEKSN